MPKTSKATAKASGKGQQGSGKLPKRIAGTKVPKAVRKSGRWAGWVSSPLGRELIASALVAAAAAIAGDQGTRPTKKPRSGQAKPGGSTRVAQAIADAAIDMVSRGLGGSDQAQAASEGTPTKAKGKSKPAPDARTFAH